MTLPNHLINHVAIALDASGSMQRHRAQVVTAVDELVKYLATLSQEMDQETRITVYTFNDKVQNIVFDRDVLRLPSIADFYEPDRQTALCDATLLALDDLGRTAQMYGDHAFLLYVFTDGQENASKPLNRSFLPQRLKALGDNWTTAILVPDIHARLAAERLGFPRNNIDTWNTLSATGMEEMAEVVKTSARTYMTARSTGTRGSKNLFGGADTVNDQTIRDSGIKPLHYDDFMLLRVIRDTPIKEFIEDAGHRYVAGRGYYQLVARTIVQANKQVAIMHKKTKKVFHGLDARKILKLTEVDTVVTPDDNKDYAIFVQSTAPNRKLFAGTELFYFKK